MYWARFSAPLALRGMLAVAFAVALCGCWQRLAPEPETSTHFTRNRANLYAGLEPDAPVVAVLDFGTRASILETHRSFVKVHTAAGQEGWMASDLLLDGNMRRDLDVLTTQSGSLPAQGVFRARDTLNVHIQPYRWSPTFYQLEKDESFEILDRMLVDRLPASAATSATTPETEFVDYWYLVRLPKLGESGWLIANMAYADIPLEVAMLAQGRSIVAYFPIGSVEDSRSGETKHTWVWFQSDGPDQTHDFDRMKVFRWDRSRRRYIVARAHSDLTGYLPVEIVEDLESERGTGVGIHVLLGKDGQIYRRTHLYANNTLYQLEESTITGTLPHIPPGGFRGRYSFTRPSQ